MVTEKYFEKKKTYRFGLYNSRIIRVQNSLKIILITSLITASLGCAHKRLPPKENIPHNIPIDVRSEIEGLYANGTKRAYAAFYLGEMGRRATPAIPYLIAILEDNKQLAQVDQQLLELLKRDAPKSPARVAAVALVKIGRPALGPLISLLLDTDKRIRSWAVLALGELDPDWRKSETTGEYVPKFLKALTSEDWSERAIAAQALGEIGDRRALAPLTAALEDEEADVRSSANLALEKIKGEKASVKKPAVALLVKELKSKSRLAREKAAEALGKAGDIQAVEPLLAALNDQDSFVRAAAALALGEIGDTRALKPLIAALKEENLRLRWRATWALGKIGKPAIGPLISVLRDEESSVQDRAEEALVKIGKPAVASLIKALKDEESNVRHRAQVILGRIGKPAVEDIIIALKDKSFDVRYGAVKSLATIGDRRAVKPLILSLSDRSQDIRQITAEALGRIGDIRAVVPLIAILKNTSYHKRVRDWASWALGEIKDIRAVEPLIGALSDETKLVQRSAADALGKIGKPALDILVPALKNKDGKVRFGAAKSLERIKWEPVDDEGEAWLLIAAQKFNEAVKMDMAAAGPLTIVLKDKDWKIRRKAAWALTMIEDWEPENKTDEIWFLIASRKLDNIAQFGEPAINPLILSLRGEDRKIREAAGNALGAIGRPAVPSLIEAMKDKNWGVRRKVAAVLGRIGDPRAVDVLIEALNDEDWYVRTKAAQGLGHIDDSRAIKPLVGLLNDEKSDVRLNAAKALFRMYWKAENKEQEARYAIASQEWDAVGNLGKAAIRPLITMLSDEDTNVRRKSAETLTKIGKYAVESLIVTLESEDGDTRRGAAWALGKIGDKRAVEPLIKILKDRLPDVRRRAATALGKLKDSRAITPLKDVSEHDPNSVARREAQSALEAIQTGAVEEQEEPAPSKKPPEPSEEKLEYYQY